MPVVLDEIAHVLNPNGKMIFFEPLAGNTVGMFVRLLTPWARIPDEQSFRRKALSDIATRFSTRLNYDQFLSVPFSVISRLLLGSPDNFLM